MEKESTDVWKKRSLQIYVDLSYMQDEPSIKGFVKGTTPQLTPHPLTYFLS